MSARLNTLIIDSPHFQADNVDVEISVGPLEFATAIAGLFTAFAYLPFFKKESRRLRRGTAGP